MVYGLDIGFTILGIQYSGNWQLLFIHLDELRNSW